MPDKKLLEENVKNLPFTEELKNILDANGVQTLKELVQTNVTAWYNWHGFAHRHQNQIVKYVRENDLLKYLKLKD